MFVWLCFIIMFVDEHSLYSSVINIYSSVFSRWKFLCLLWCLISCSATHSRRTVASFERSKSCRSWCSIPCRHALLPPGEVGPSRHMHALVEGGMHLMDLEIARGRKARAWTNDGVENKDERMMGGEVDSHRTGLCWVGSSMNGDAAVWRGSGRPS
jgi:hypothetical protein